MVFGQGSIHANGVYSRWKSSLDAAGLVVIEHGKVRSNPVLSHVRQGNRPGKKKQGELVLGMGGRFGDRRGQGICAGGMVEHGRGGNSLLGNSSIKVLAWALGPLVSSPLGVGSRGSTRM